MAVTNYERVGKGLDLLRAGLAPFVERELKNRYRDGALNEALNFVSDDRNLVGQPLEQWDVAALLKARRVRKIICSFPRQVDSQVFDALYRAGDIELELVPQGNLAERIRAAGAGIGGFFTPTGYGTDLAKGKETRLINGRGYVLEFPIHADFALIKAERGDRWGNLVYRKTARNFAPIMATAARCAVVQVHEIVELGALDPEAIVTPGIFVKRVVRVERSAAGADAGSRAA